MNGVLTDLKANRFKDAQAVYDDLNLIFLNALHYNREDSQIAKDANTLKVRPNQLTRRRTATNPTRATLQGILEAEWAKRPSLPSPGHQTSVNQRRASSEVDIDGGMSESEPTNETSRVAQSDEIVRQLEKSLPRWEGFGPGGWSVTIHLVRFSFSSPRNLILTRRFRRTRCRLLSKFGITRMQGTRLVCLPKPHDSDTPLQWNATQHHSGCSPGHGFET